MRIEDLKPKTMPSHQLKFTNSNYKPYYSAVGNVSGYRCEFDCRSRGHKFDPCHSNTFMGIDHEIVSSVILLRLAESFKKGCCQLQAKVCAYTTG